MATQSSATPPQTRRNLWKKTSKKPWLSVALAAVACSVALTACKVSIAKGQESFADLPEVGKRSLARFDVPADIVSAFASRNNKAQPTGLVKDVGMPTSWMSPEVTLNVNDGPFMAVLVIDGKAEAANTRAKYELGWEGLESTKPGLQYATIVNYLMFGHYGESKDVYPLAVHKAASSAPFRIEKPQKVKLVLSADEIKGIVPERMRLELRAGVGSGGLMSWILNWPALFLGLVMVFVWWWLFKRER